MTTDPGSGDVGPKSLPLLHFKATLLIVSEFIALQLVAGGITTGIYSLIPLLDAGYERHFDHWMRAFQILSPTLTISGGAAIVLSSYIFHKMAQEAQHRAAEAEKRVAEERTRAAVAEDRAASAETAISELRAELAELRAELAARGPRRRRRNLR